MGHWLHEAVCRLDLHQSCQAVGVTDCVTPDTCLVSSCWIPTPQIIDEVINIFTCDLCLLDNNIQLEISITNNRNKSCFHVDIPVLVCCACACLVGKIGNNKKRDYVFVKHKTYNKIRRVSNLCYSCYTIFHFYIDLEIIID